MWVGVSLLVVTVMIFAPKSTLLAVAATHGLNVRKESTQVFTEGCEKGCGIQKALVLDWLEQFI